MQDLFETYVWWYNLNTLFCFRWNSFHGDLNKYRKALEGALEIHALIREIDDINERMSEKVQQESMTSGITEWGKLYMESQRDIVLLPHNAMPLNCEV